MSNDKTSYLFEPITLSQKSKRARSGKRANDLDGKTWLQYSISVWNDIKKTKLLQEMSVGVQLIQWGHPNTREPGKTEVDAEKSTWAKEHQIKIFPEEFEPIGFYSQHKQTILEEFIEYNKKTFGRNHEECNPLEKDIRQPKSRHPCENHEKIPERIRGRHFDGYWQICKALGCAQGKPSQQKSFDFMDVIENDV